MRKFMKNLTWLVVLAMTLALLFSCQKEKPLPTGYAVVIGDREGVIADSLFKQKSGTEEYFSRLINTGTSTNLILGEIYNYHSAIYLMFEDLPLGSQIHSATLKLTNKSIDSILVQTSHPFTANFYLAEYKWENDQDPEQYIDQLPFNKLPFQTTTITPDTIDEVEIELDTLIVQEWVDTTSSQTNYGIWIDSPDADFLNNYYSIENQIFDSAPQLELVYTMIEDSEQKLDTSIFVATGDAFLLLNNEDDLNLNKDHIYIGKGFAFRSFIKFNLEAFDTTIHVNRSTLELTINKNNSVGSTYNALDCIIYRVDTESWNKGEVNETPETSSYLGTLTDSTLTFDVTATVQAWLGTRYPNYGFLIRSLDESTIISRISFYSTKTNEEFQPRLHIYYTLSPELEF